MTIEEKIDLMIGRARSKVSQTTRKQKIKLYAIGVKEKIQEARFSLENLQTYSQQSGDVSGDISIDDKVHFYCDCFWGFLYATLDVLAQVINQAERLGLNEKKASFETIASNHLTNPITNNPTLKASLDKIIRSNAFKNLKKYRNCSLHRRHIYFETKSRRGSAGYVGICETKRYLCDNPYALSPATGQQREVGDYCKKVFNQISDLLLETIDDILP